jgi:biopolymer transport protein ExbB/TolQ
MGLLLEGFGDGGVFMWPILMCALVGATVALERAFFIFLRAAVHGPIFMASVQRHVLDGNVDGAIKLCNAEPAAALPRVVKAALLRAERPEAELRDAVEEATLEVYPEVNRRLGYLPTIANVSTLLGLLGTIQGLIISFHAVGEASAAERATALSSGIAVAMYTTFFGLLVSIPILVVHSLVAARANALLDEVDHYGLRTINLLNALRVSPSQPQGGGPTVLPFPGR